MLALFGGSPVRTQPFPRWPIFGDAEEARLLRSLRGGNWGRLHGEEVAEFEQRFAAMHGCRHGIAVVNGTVSLRIALLAAGIQAEDEVIVPPYTFISTASAVIEANAVPVFADVELETFNLDPRAVEAAITPRTKAIIPVHFAGQPAAMDRLMAIARERRLVVIEDAAHAHGASDSGRPAGSLGHMASFSFQSSKNLPDGIWYEHHVLAGNYRLGEFQGAVLNAQLDRLDDQTATRDANGRHLASRLAALPGLHPQARPASCTRHSYHLFMARLDAAVFGAPRAAVLDALRAEGIPCSAGYGWTLPRQPVFRDKAFGPYLAGAVSRLDYTAQADRCVNADLLCREQAIWLEQSLMLGARNDIDDIARAFEKVHEHRNELAATLR